MDSNNDYSKDISIASYVYGRQNLKRLYVIPYNFILKFMWKRKGLGSSSSYLTVGYLAFPNLVQMPIFLVFT